MQQLSDLISDWRRSAGSEELLAFGRTVSRLMKQRQSFAGKSSAGILREEIQGCGWEMVVLAAKFVLVDVACGSGILPACAAAFIVFLDQLIDTADPVGGADLEVPAKEKGV